MLTLYYSFLEQLVCEFFNCSVEEGCISGYQVCSEDPDLTELQANDHSDHYCFSGLNINVTTGELTPNFKRCFIGAQHADCGRNRCLAAPLVETGILYTCCCNTNLCNVNVEMLPPLTVLPGQSSVSL